MKTKDIVICVLILILGIFIGRSDIKEAQASSGRYQIVANDRVVYHLNSDTGQILKIDSIGGQIHKEYILE